MNKAISLAATVMLAAGMSAVASPAFADCAQPTEPNCGAANGAGGWLPDKPVTRPKPAARVSVKWHTVRRGETLWHIAVVSYGGTQHAGQQYRKIMRLNHLRSTTIRIGQRLRVR